MIRGPDRALTESLPELAGELEAADATGEDPEPATGEAS